MIFWYSFEISDEAPKDNLNTQWHESMTTWVVGYSKFGTIFVTMVKASSPDEVVAIVKSCFSGLDFDKFFKQKCFPTQKRNAFMKFPIKITI